MIDIVERLRKIKSTRANEKKFLLSGRIAYVFPFMDECKHHVANSSFILTETAMNNSSNIILVPHGIEAKKYLNFFNKINVKYNKRIIYTYYSLFCNELNRRTENPKKIIDSIKEVLCVFKPEFVVILGGEKNLFPSIIAARELCLPFAVEFLNPEYNINSDTKKLQDPTYEFSEIIENHVLPYAAICVGMEKIIDTFKISNKIRILFNIHAIKDHSDIVQTQVSFSELLTKVEQQTPNYNIDRPRLAHETITLRNLFSKGQLLRTQLETLSSRIPDSNGTHYYKKHDVSVAIITDEFMYNYYKDVFTGIHYISPTNYQDVFDIQKPDLFIFVSCWHGLSEQEWTGVTFTDSLQQSIRDILTLCRERSIPTIFQTIEDPSNYHKFIAIAKGFDIIFTTDIGKINDYMHDCNHQQVFYGEYGINPIFNNPIGHRYYRINGAFFAGSYPARYKARCADMEALFDSFLNDDISLVIADRNSDSSVENYKYPDRYESSIIPKIDHKTLQKIHKLFRYNINFNSIKHSMTMCAMRIYELQAQGSLMISNYAMSVANRFPNIIVHNAGDSFDGMFNFSDILNWSEYEREIRSIRNILSKKNVFEKSAIILRSAGIQVEIPDHKILVLCEKITESVVKNFHRQTYRNRFLQTEEQAVFLDLQEYVYVAYFSENIEYECDYLMDMINAFKFTDSEYVTKNTYFNKNKYIKGSQNTYTSHLKNVALTIFRLDRYSINRIIDLKNEKAPIYLKKGYSASPFGANYGQYCQKNAKENKLLNEFQPDVSVIIPFHEVSELLLYRVIDCLYTKPSFNKLHLIFWISEDTCIVPGSILHSLCKSHENIEIYRSNITKKDMIETFQRCRSNVVHIRHPEVQSSPDCLIKLLDIYKKVVDQGMYPDIICGYEIIIGEKTREIRLTKNNTKGFLTEEQVEQCIQSKIDFPINSALINKKLLLHLAGRISIQNDINSFFSVIQKELINIAKNVYEIQSISTVSYEQDYDLLWKYANKDSQINNYRYENSIYFLYGEKWWISASWSGASVNVINEMFVLSRRYAVFYNDVYINDLFSENGILNEEAFRIRYQEIIKTIQPIMSSVMPKIIKPSRNYYASFFRGENKSLHTEFFLRELPEPKIYGHNYVKEIWNSSIVGFQNKIAARLSMEGKLRVIGDDGTLNYENIDNSPSRFFIRHQAITMNLLSKKKIVEIRNKQKKILKDMLRSDYIVGIGGTITSSSYPDSLLFAIKELRKKYPEKNISLVIFALNVTEKLPDETWIHVKSYKKEDQVDALLSVDVLVNPWREKSQEYFASNRTLDAISLCIPYITPRTEARVEQLGNDYPLYHDFYPSDGRYPEDVENQLQNLLTLCMQDSYTEKVKDYLLNRRERFCANRVIKKYEAQLQRLYRKRILIVVQGLGVGGVENYTIQMLKCLKNFLVTIYCSELVPIERMELIKGICPWVRVIKNEDMLLEEYDYAFLNSYPVDGKSLKRLILRLRLNDCKIYPIVHTDIHAFTVSIANFIIYCSGLITVAERIIKKLEANNGMAITDKSHLITPVMDKKNINELPQKVNPTKKLGYFGRIVPIKGVHFLVKSFCKLLSEHPDIDYELHIYGPFAKESYFHEVLELIESNWKSRIFLYNEVFNSEKRQDILKDLDLLVYTTAMDGLPYVFLEAMSLGTPVISTNVGGISHLINDGVNGRLMNFNGLYVEDLKESAPYNKLLDIMKLREEEYYEEFKRVLLPLLLDFDKIKEMSLNSIKIVGCDYDISMMNRHFKRIIYNNLLC